jgi:hypothetical protein
LTGRVANPARAVVDAGEPGTVVAVPATGSVAVAGGALELAGGGGTSEVGVMAGTADVEASGRAVLLLLVE